MAGYEYEYRAVQQWDFQAQAALYYDLAQNNARNAQLWKAKYEALAKKVNA